MQDFVHLHGFLQYINKKGSKEPNLHVCKQLNYFKKYPALTSGYAPFTESCSKMSNAGITVGGFYHLEFDKQKRREQ